MGQALTLREPERELARRWLDERAAPRGEAERLLREARAGAAAEAAEAELARRPRDLASLCLAGIARAAAGEPERARAHLQSALARHPRSALAWALKGLLLDGAEDGAARRSLERAVRLSPREAFPLALRAQLHRAGGDLSACLEDLDRALARRREAWLHRLRAECLEKLGRLEAALADADAGLSLDPRQAALHELRGHCLFHRKDYEGAAQAFSRGLALEPESAALLRRRAEALWLAGRAAEAEADLRRCAALRPDDLGYRLSLARLLVAAERPGAARALDALERLGPEAAAGAALLRGMRDFRRGRYAGAERHFARAETAARAGRFPGRFVDAGYSLLARGFEFMRRHRASPPKKTSRPLLILTGLGLDYPHQATLEVLKALSECDIVVNNLAGAESMEFLGMFCRDVRTISFEGANSKTWAEKVLSWVEPGRTVAFVTRGHPLVSGHLALNLMVRARARGVETRCLGAISSIDQLLCLTQEVLSETYWGLKVLDSQLLLADAAAPEPSLPTLVYIASPASSAHAATVRRLCAVFTRAYPARHQALVFGPRYDKRETRPVPVGELERFLLGLEPRMLSSHILLLPPVKTAVPRQERPRTRRRRAA